MKHSIGLKMIAILLAACALTAALISGLGVILVAEAGLYTVDYATWEAQLYENRAQILATCMAESYAAREMGDLSEEQLRYIGWGNAPETIGGYWDMDPADWCYTIADIRGSTLESNYNSRFKATYAFTREITARYPVKSSGEGDWEANYEYWEAGITSELYIAYAYSPEYAVTVWLAPGSVSTYNGIRTEVFELLAHLREAFLVGVAAGLLLAATLLVYLFCAAGKKYPSDAPKPDGLNRLPLDVYGVGTGAACVFAALGTVEIVENFLCSGGGFHVGWLTVSVVLVLAAAVCIVGFLFALAAQWKMHGCYIWKHSLTGRCCGKLWQWTRKGFRFLCRLGGMLPLIWRYLLIGLAMWLLPLWFFYLAAVGESFWVFFLLLACLCDAAIICYGAYAYGTVLQGAQKMAAGELYAKINTQYLVGSYRTCAENLNTLADVAVVAARNQMKSDRMKTELITNVSHDIKTPLTSIINYIDLLQKAETPEQTAQYTQVLERQSQRLKKLIEDLMEMSKATTGNLAVDITRVDAVEAVNQALGEFSDKLESQELRVVFHQPERSVPICADGRLTWRVLSNLLSNVVKYALPGTRVYVDVVELDGRVLISVKNISREELNISADELTERFVRGDASRNTEGSGLGLNIAKSLMELQKGQLQLLVDGDLFKVTLIFPMA